MDSVLQRSPLARIILGGVAIVSIVMFLFAWVATLITSGFAVAGTHTYAGWTYFPMFWPHLAAATLGAMLFLRFGANTATALAAVVMYLIAFIGDLFGAILYWRLFWLCNITGKDKLTGVAIEICAKENPLLISLMVFATVALVVAGIGAVAHGFDFFQARRSGSNKSRANRKTSAALLIFGGAGLVSLLVMVGLMIANWVTSAVSLAAGSAGQTYAVWAHGNIFLVQLSASVLSLMLSLRYGYNKVTGGAAVVLWVIGFFSATYGTVLYWRLGWFCIVSSSSTLRGIDLVICTQEESYLIALWVMTSVLWVCAIIAPIGHVYDYASTMNAKSVGSWLSLGGGGGGGGNGGDSDLGIDQPTAVSPNQPQDQLATYEDGSLLSAQRMPSSSSFRRGNPGRIGRSVGRGSAWLNRSSRRMAGRP